MLFGGSTQETTCAKVHPVGLLLLRPSPFQQMAFLSRKSRPQTSQSEAETCLYKSQEQILSGRSPYPLAALQTQRERHAIQLHFPPTRAEFILKKRRCEVCAAKIINDLDRDGAVITDCGASQGSLWKQYTSCHLCGVPA